MVSTRGPKPKFDIGERVLCYEPDPKKIKMLYDAKVLDLRPSQKVRRFFNILMINFLYKKMQLFKY